MRVIDDDKVDGAIRIRIIIRTTIIIISIIVITITNINYD